MIGAGRVLAVIPARGGSKGLPGKNLRSLAGLPLIVHSLRCAQLSPQIDRTVVSTDNEEIAAVARSHGGDVPFVRPSELAEDSTPMWPVVRHAIEAMEQIDATEYAAVLLLDPTSPGRLPSDIQGAIDLLERSPDCDGVVGVSRPRFNPIWHCVVEERGVMRDLMPDATSYARRQDVPTVYRINATLYLWRRNFVRSAGDWRSGRLKLFEVPEHRAIHIDDIEELELAELCIRHGLLSLPWLS